MRLVSLLWTLLSNPRREEACSGPVSWMKTPPRLVCLYVCMYVFLYVCRSVYLSVNTQTIVLTSTEYLSHIHCFNQSTNLAVGLCSTLLSPVCRDYPSDRRSHVTRSETRHQRKEVRGQQLDPSVRLRVTQPVGMHGSL